MLKLMIAFASLLALFTLPVVLGVNEAMAEDGIVLRQVAIEAQDYCHIKYQAFKVETLGNPEPEFNPDDLIDFYGPCSLNPRSPEVVQKQVSDATRWAMGQGENSESGGSE